MDKQRFTHGYVAFIFTAMFFYGFSTQAVGTLITRIIEHYGIRMAQAGLLSSFTSAGNFAAIFIITIFVGRINKMLLMGSCLFLYAVSLFLVSSMPPFGIILVSFALIGIFGATIDTLNNSLTADLMPENLSRNMSLLHGLFGLGGLSGPIVIEPIASRLGWAQIYFIISCAFFIYLLAYAIFLVLNRNFLEMRVSREKQGQFGFFDILRFFTQKRNVLLWVAMFFYGGNQSTLAVWIKRYVETFLNEPAWGAYTLSAMWLGTAVCRLFISPNIKASSPKKIFFGNLISAVVLSAGLFSASAQGITAASLMVGLSSGLTIPLILTIGCELYKEKTAFGTLMPFTALFIAYVVFPPLSGFVSDSLGIPWGVALGGLSALATALLSAVLGAALKAEKA